MMSPLEAGGELELNEEVWINYKGKERRLQFCSHHLRKALYLGRQARGQAMPLAPLQNRAPSPLCCDSTSRRLA